MKPKHLFFYFLLFLISSCCPDCLEPIDCSDCPPVIPQERTLLRGKYLKCYVLHESEETLYQTTLLGIYTKTTGEVPALALKLQKHYKIDSTIYLKLGKSGNELVIIDETTNVPEPANIFGGAEHPTRNVLVELKENLVDLEERFHMNDLSEFGWHTKGHIIINRIEGLFKVFNPLIDNAPVTSLSYYTYDFNEVSVSDTIVNYVIDTIANKFYLRTVNENHYPHAPNN